MKKKSLNHERKVKLIMDLTKLSRSKAISLLERNKDDINAACDAYASEVNWDFTLPTIPAPESLASHLPARKRQELGVNGTPTSSLPVSAYDLDDDLLGFSLRDLIGAIQAGEKCDIIRAYLTHFSEKLGSVSLKSELNVLLDGCPGIFFVVETGNAEMIKVWTCHARNANHTYRRVPVLGFAIALCQTFRKDMPLVVKTLLSLGWSADVIPAAFYEPLHCDLLDGGQPEDESTDPGNDATEWCVADVRERITRGLNFSFTIRYVLHLASRDKRLSGGNEKVAQVHKAAELLGIRYFLVGQTLASGLLTERFLTYLAMPVRQPLVLLFAGPSGHGKTELARNLGQLLSLSLHSVDCTNLRAETDLFGPWFPYQGWEKGSAVNNYLAEHNGQRCIVFMDEFEKTRDEVRRGLLVPFQSGEYRDRRTLVRVNCSQTIWVLATNAFDEIIHAFCDSHRDELFSDRASEETDALVRKLGRDLSRKIQKASINAFGAPLTGRITDFIPFLPFSPIEQAAVADMYLADLGRELAKPIDTCEETARYRPVGNVDLQVKRGYSVNKALAEQGYVKELGARSIINTIDREVRMPLVGSYLAAREEIREDQPAASFVVGVDVESGEVDISQCVVE